MPNPRLRTLCAAAIAVAVALVSCDSPTMKHEYRPVSVGGWDRGDTLAFRIDSVETPGLYDLDIGVRTTSGYPYQKLWLHVVAELHNPDTLLADTLACRLVGDDGRRDGRGADTYQKSFRMGSVALERGQCGRITVRHIMQREVLSGITDIGVRLSR